MNTLAKLTKLIAILDERLNDMINSILHDTKVKALESSWRSVHRLLLSVGEKNIQVKCLHLTYAELKRDLLDAMDFDQSQIFKKIYSEAFDMPGGEPFGLWIGDYTFAINDPHSLQVLKQVSDVAAASFCPFTSTVSLASMGIDDRSNWHRLQDFEYLSKAEFKAWEKLRDYPNAQFVSLVLPALLLRQPYQEQEMGFCFSEVVQSADDYLWGNPAYALGGVILQAFSEYSWFDFIQGEPFGGQKAGVVQHYPAKLQTNQSQFKELGMQVYLTESQEWSLNQQGLMTLFTKQYDKALIFYYMPSIKRAQQNHIDHLLPYLLCVCRFAQYLKVICRDKIGAFSRPAEVEQYLYNWIRNYCAGNDDLPLTSFGQYPLKDAKILVRSQV